MLNNTPYIIRRRPKFIWWMFDEGYPIPNPVFFSNFEHAKQHAEELTKNSWFWLYEASLHTTYLNKIFDEIRYAKSPIEKIFSNDR